LVQRHFKEMTHFSLMLSPYFVDDAGQGRYMVIAGGLI
jgi:hypothetical protein